MKNVKWTKSGFTMVEVVLVLAIAGLIFAATFIALPNLWASQRDSARKENIMTFVTNLKNYQTNNNRGALPGAESSNGGGTSDNDNIKAGHEVTVNGDEVFADRANEESARTINALSWSGFYRDYMNDTFEDPAGQHYNLYVADCGNLRAGDACNNRAFSELIGVNNINSGGNNWVDYTLYVAVGASCDGDTAVKSLNMRNVAVVYKLERAGQFCYNS